MSGSHRTSASTAGLAGAMTAALALAVGLDVAIGPPVKSKPGTSSPTEKATTPASPTLVDPEAADRVPIGAELAAAAEPAETLPQELPADPVRRAVASLAASLDPEVFHGSGFETQARALAASIGPAQASELAALAADEGRTNAEVVAAAEILRHVPAPDGFALPAPALARLRSAWEERGSDPVLASGAVRALAVFGDAVDRDAMIAQVTEQAPASVADLACAGLSAARGNEAADDLVRALSVSADARRSAVALSALTAVASAPDRDLSEEARARCAEALLRMPEPRTPSETARYLAALSALDPGRAKAPLLAALSDPQGDAATRQSAASALATIPEAEPELLAMVRDGRQDESHRVLAAEVLLRRGADPWGEARSTLERVRDGRSGPAGERRAARVLERAIDSEPAR